MALVTYKNILSDARENRYAIPCFNVVDMETLCACIETAEKMKAPLIIAVAQVHMPFINIEKFVPLMKKCAEQASVPVCIMLDHAYSIEVIEKLLDLGINTIMYDISTYPIDKHMELMKKMVEYCDSKGAQVEGELGYLDREQASWDAQAERKLKNNFKEGSEMTRPEQATEYINNTGIEGLAVSIGNTHGMYTESANINFQLLSKINKVSNVPLVLHGSSGISNQDLAEAVQRGICKVNYYTGISKAGVNALRKHLNDNPDWKDYHPLLGIVKDAMVNVIQEKITVLKTNGKSW